MSLVKAIRIATLKHGQAVDKGGQPFIGHPLRVMAAVAAKYDDVPEYVLEAAVCHDVLEDTGTDPMELTAEGISNDALALIKILTRDDTSEAYFEYIARIKRASLDWAIRIKLCDLADNLNPARRVPGMKLPERYERAVEMLRG